ncbi:hypothetical protein [Dactylosporangium sp. CA-233914]|uniref:hypothetical protein n=1 Tax=Dactylosporangium sp. CA-233914 TaxID=3239934 RepID=UPI003D937D8F
MTEQPLQPLDHLDPPSSSPDPDTAATQPLPSPMPVPPDPDDATQPLPPPPPRQHPIHRPPAGLIAALAVGVVIAGAVLVMLIGRIDRKPAEAAETAPQRFASPQALVEYLDRRGLPCTGYEPVDASAALGRGRCEAAGQEVGVGVYAIHSDVEAQWSSLADGGRPLFMALGENWTVEGPADWTRRVAEVMNAQYRQQP